MAVLALALTLTGCDNDPIDPEPLARFEIEVSGEAFMVEVVTNAQVAELEARLASGATGVVIGPLLAGDGGFNAPWSWHLDPEQVHTADAAIEVCDGRPSMVEADLTYWLETLGQFCPWGARVVRRLN